MEPRLPNTPAQFTGEAADAEASLELTDEATAIDFFNTVKDRLLTVNNWHKLAGVFSAGFQLTDASGEPLEQQAAKNNYIRIDVPGPGSSAGDGYDWVCIEALDEVQEQHRQSINMRVRPCKRPTGNGSTAHFYSAISTSNFIAVREYAIISAYILDRNLEPNKEGGFLLDKIRHLVVGVPAMKGFSKLQWQMLVKAWLTQ